MRERVSEVPERYRDPYSGYEGPSRTWLPGVGGGDGGGGADRGRVVGTGTEQRDKRREALSVSENRTRNDTQVGNLSSPVSRTRLWSGRGPLRSTGSGPHLDRETPCPYCHTSHLTAPRPSVVGERGGPAYLRPHWGDLLGTKV